MFNKEEYIKEFVEAGVALDNEKMVELSHKVQDMPLEQRIELIEKIYNELKEKEDVQEELLKEFEQTIGLLKFAEEIQEKAEDSAGEDAKEQDSKAEEVTQDVAADTSAAEAESKDEAEVEGNAPAEEEKEEK